MKYMTSLHHLYTHGCDRLKHMPPDLGKLTSLQTLTCFVVGSGSNCSNVGELQHLDIGGHLELHNLQNVTESDAINTKLDCKRKITELSLVWNEDEPCNKTLHGRHNKVMEALRPHDKLLVLKVASYKGTTLPSWVSMLEGIIELDLSTSYTNCEIFHSCGSCITSKFFDWLDLIDCNICVALSFNGWSNKIERQEEPSCDNNKSSTALPNFSEELQLVELNKFERWQQVEATHDKTPTVSNLESISIMDCPELAIVYLKHQKVPPTVALLHIEIHYFIVHSDLAARKCRNNASR
uniref:R13L1/DRL21-like LRR repeat region domain-containing protein n=1 Tax=Oryza punctata TaxID=4537 RepID=A0A0E0JIC9_ORYPU